MKIASARRGVLPGIAALAIALSACSAGNSTSSDTSGDSAGSGLSGTLNGGGSSAQEKAQNAWRAGFQTANPDATVTYDPVGSGDGRKNFISGATAFAGTDSALDDDEGELTGAQDRCGGDVIQVPGYVSPIAVVFNLEGIDAVNMSPATIAGVFAGEITTWDAPEIAADNDGVDLPSTKITVVHRADDSGTTENFTKYLQATAADTWTYEPDGVWPDALSGASGEGTSGLIDLVSQGDGSIGYADDSAAGDLGTVAVGVGEEFNQPSAEGAAQVVAASPRTEGVPATDMAVDLARDTTEAGSYPVLLVSYLLACSSYDDAETADLVKGYLTYVLSSDGQDAAASEAGSAPLDTDLASEAQGLVDAISG